MKDNDTVLQEMVVKRDGFQKTATEAQRLADKMNVKIEAFKVGVVAKAAKDAKAAKPPVTEA